VLDSLFVQPLSKSSLVWNPPFHAPYICSPNHCLLFATHAHTIATCFAVVPRFSSVTGLSQLFTWNSIFSLNATHPSDHSHLCLLKCHLIYFPHRPCNILLRKQLLYSFRLILLLLLLLLLHPFAGIFSTTTCISRH